MAALRKGYWALLLWLAGQSMTFAACTVNPAIDTGSINFGSHPSQSIPAGGISPNGTAVDAHFSVTCTGLTLTLLSLNSWLTYTATQPLVLSNGTDTIPYVIASNSTYSPNISLPGQSIGNTSGSLLTLIVLSGNNIRVPLHIRTSPTTVWPSAGTYTANQSLTVSGSICTFAIVLCGTYSPVNGPVNFTLTLNVSKSCEFMSVPAMVDFGTVSFVEDATTLQLQASVRCTHQEDYLIYADNGNHSSGGVRHLAGPGGVQVAYGIYHPGNLGQPLGVTSPASRMGTGVTENIQFPVDILDNQPTPPAGVYTDNVRLVIEY